MDDGGEASGGSLRTLDRQGARADLQRHRRHRRDDHLRGRKPLPRVHIVGASRGVARRRLQPRRRHRRHRRRAHHRRHAPRHRPRDQHFAGRRLRARREPACRFSRQLPPGRRCPRRAARPDARGNGAMAQSPCDELADATRHRGGSPQSIDADQGVRFVRRSSSARCRFRSRRATQRKPQGLRAAE